MKQGNFITDGVYFISVYSCYKIETSLDGDAARVKYSYYSELQNKEIETPAKWQVIKYTRKGDPFVTFKGKKLMLSDFQRV